MTPRQKDLIAIASKLVSNNKGLLAMDESVGTANKRFAALGIPQTVDYRRDWRELILSTPGLGDYLNGVILFDETIRQSTLSGIPFLKLISDACIIAGIKVDQGTDRLAGHAAEKITEGLDGLRARLKEYYSMGARFAKWRAVIEIGDGRPSNTAIALNAHALARYAALCQDEGIVPIVEPEVLMEGSHSLEQCFTATEAIQTALFEALHRQGVLLEGLLLKPNMVLAGLGSGSQPSISEVAEATVRCLRRTTPAAVAGVVFLSGGQPAELATERLAEMNRTFRAQLPWPLTFSYSRAIQQEAMEIWAGNKANTKAAQDSLIKYAGWNVEARKGISQAK